MASLAALALAAVIARDAWAAEVAEAVDVKIEQAGDVAKVTIDGKPFADYVSKSGHQPIIWPIVGPSGKEMTRQFPMRPKLQSEADDHPHHRSLWFNHGVVNGLDFWLEPADSKKHDNQIVQRGEATITSGDPAEIVTKNDWMSDGVKVCEDERTIKFGADDHGRWIDFTVVVTASEGDLTFGDTKEGAFGLRVPGTMSVDAHKGGKIRNSRDQEDAVAWGQSAEWVDYNGPVDGEAAGIVVFDMPDSFRHPARWHVRTYGLFAANPFGQHDFPRDDHEQGAKTLKQGESLKLHYRVLFYDGAKPASEIAEIYKEYIAE